MYNYEPHMRWEKGCCYYHTINVGKVFRHFNHFSISTNAEQNLLHTVLNWSYILTRLSKSLLSGIFKSWRDHHNIPYFYVHILYQFVGFIHYKDGINKRRRIKRSFIVLHFAKSSDSPWLTKTLCATNFTKIRTFWSPDFHHGLDPTM